MRLFWWSSLGCCKALDRRSPWSAILPCGGQLDCPFGRRRETLRFTPIWQDKSDLFKTFFLMGLNYGIWELAGGGGRMLFWERFLAWDHLCLIPVMLVSIGNRKNKKTEELFVMRVNSVIWIPTWQFYSRIL